MSSRPWTTAAGTCRLARRAERSGWVTTAAIWRIVASTLTPRSQVSSARARAASSSWGKPGDPIIRPIRTLPSTYSSRPPRVLSSTGISFGCCQPTVRRPVVDMMLTSERTRAGASIAIVCAIMPPIETPVTCADSQPRWSISPSASPAMSERP